jgi:hypothetical protein
VFQTTTAGLDAGSFPMRLYEKAKRLGTWDPSLLALAAGSESFDPYEVPPFGLDEAEFVDYATSQFQKRLARIEQAREHGLGSIELDELEA